MNNTSTRCMINLIVLGIMLLAVTPESYAQEESSTLTLLCKSWKIDLEGTLGAMSDSSKSYYATLSSTQKRALKKSLSQSTGDLPSRWTF